LQSVGAPTVGSSIRCKARPIVMLIHNSAAAVATIKLLVDHGIPERAAASVTRAGYTLHSFRDGRFSSESYTAVMDTYYGTKTSGIIRVEQFVSYLNGQALPKPRRTTEIYRNVRSVNDVLGILKADRHQRYIQGRSLCFRGQPKDILIKRPIPNPYVCDESGRERIIAPSFWRSYVRKPLSERPAGQPISVFATMDADPLIYKGIPDWTSLSDRNTQRYGLHTMSDLEDFADPDSQEYWRRYVTHKLEGRHNTDLPLLEQHYGMKTIGLDVSFDPLVSMFFASHEYHQRPDGTATFRPIPKGGHKGVLYCFVFRDPPVTATGMLVEELKVFQHIKPMRPLVQKCALVAFQQHEISAAALDLDAIMFLDKSFVTDGLPAGVDLFPIAGDEFYMALLEEKRKGRGFWHDIAEYDFGRPVAAGGRRRPARQVKLNWGEKKGPSR
jgi:hypothetical protein